MAMIYIQIIGCGVFFISTVVLGVFLRKYPSEKARETTTMALHFIALVAFFLTKNVVNGYVYKMTRNPIREKCKKEKHDN